MKRRPLKDRIREALRNGPRSYYDTIAAVFPEDQYPRAFRCSSNGGPPGCAMAFGRALREMGVWEGLREHGRMLRLP